MISSALAFSGFIAMLAILFLWHWRWNRLREELEQTIKRSHPGRFNKLVEGWTDVYEISLIPRRRFIRFLREEEYLSLGDSDLSEKCRSCYRRYRQGLWFILIALTYVGLWFWLDPNVKIG